MNFSSSNKKDLNGSCFVILVTTIFSVVGAIAGAAATTAGWTGVICSGVSTSGGNETPTPVSDGMKSGGGSLGSRYGAGTDFLVLKPPVDLYWFFEISIRTEKKISVSLLLKFYPSLK